MLMTLPHAAGREFFARFGGNLLLVERQLVDSQAEQQELPWIEAFVLGTVEAFEKRSRDFFHRLLHSRLHRVIYCALQLGLMLLRELVQLSTMRLLAFDERRFAFANDPLQVRRIIGQLVHIQRSILAHARCTSRSGRKFRTTQNFSDFFNRRNER